MILRLYLGDGINLSLRIACVTRCAGKAMRGVASLSSYAHTANYTRRQTHFVIVKDVTGFNSAVCRCSSDRNRTCAPRVIETSAALWVGGRNSGQGTGRWLRAAMRGEEEYLPLPRPLLVVCYPRYNNGVLR